MVDKVTLQPVPGHLFMSHASEDLTTAQSLATELRNHEVATWLAAESLTMGENYAEEIYRNLRNAHHVVVLLSSSSIESPHVRREVNSAIDMGKPILPITLNPGIMASPDLPLDWRYWLGIVQVYTLSTFVETAEIIRHRVFTPPRPHAAGSAQRRSKSSSSLDDAALRKAIKTNLIQVATHGGRFGLVLDRCKKLRCGADLVTTLANEYKETGLILFEDPLNRETKIQLTT